MGAFLRDQRSKVSGLLLSGGDSRRFGGRPKALLEVGGEKALLRMARIAREFGIDPLTVVVPPDSSEVETVARAIATYVVRSERSLLGRTASIQEGLRALPGDRDVLLWPVDHSFVRGETVGSLLEAWARDPLGRWFIPKWRGHGGHPVLVGHELFGAVAALGPDEPLRDLLATLGPLVVHVPVSDPAVATPVDTPEAYRAACERLRDDPEAV